jgi:hypothetical protein
MRNNFDPKALTSYHATAEQRIFDLEDSRAVTDTALITGIHSLVLLYRDAFSDTPFSACSLASIHRTVQYVQLKPKAAPAPLHPSC